MGRHGTGLGWAAFVSTCPKNNQRHETQRTIPPALHSTPYSPSTIKGACWMATTVSSHTPMNAATPPHTTKTAAAPYDAKCSTSVKPDIAFGGEQRPYTTIWWNATVNSALPPHASTKKTHTHKSTTSARSRLTHPRRRRYAAVVAESTPRHTVATACCLRASLGILNRYQRVVERAIELPGRVDHIVTLR